MYGGGQYLLKGKHIRGKEKTSGRGKRKLVVGGKENQW